MKKSTFTALILGTISGMFFSLGMCMALISEWNAFYVGIIFGAIGIVLGLITLIIWRKMTKKAPIKISGKGIAAIAVGITGSLLLGIGMCFCMVWGNLPLGIIIGILGIAALLCLIPIIGGIKEE